MPEGDIDVFISYKKEEADKAQRLVEALEAAGYSAVYDATSLNLNENFADKLESLIRRARRVVVLWTEKSSASDWVRDEARLARDLDKYLGVVVEPKTDIALDLRNLHKIDLTRMTFDAGVEVIVREIADQLGPGSLTPAVLAEANFFRAVEAGGTRGGYEAYLGAHPTGRYAEQARRNLAALPRWRAAPIMAAIFFAALTGIGGYFAAGHLGSQTPDASQVASLTDDLEAVTVARDAAIAGREDAQAEVRRLINELKNLTQQEVVTDVPPSSLDSSSTDIERLRQQRDTARASNIAIREALANAQARIAELGAEPAPAPPAAFSPVLPAQPDCRTSSQAGIQILVECYPLSTASLSVRDPEFVDASPLSGLTSLRRLFLDGTQIADVSPLSGLSSLERLTLSGTRVTNFSPLRNLANLHYLRTPDGKSVGTASNTSKGRRLVADYIAAHSK